MSLLHTAVGVFTISNPIGNLPIFLSFTNGNPRQDLAIARSAAFTFVVAYCCPLGSAADSLTFLGSAAALFRSQAD